MRLEKNSIGAVLRNDAGLSEQMNATELLELSAELKNFVLDNVSSFSETPVKKNNFRGRTFLVEVSDKLWFWEDFEAGRWEVDTFNVFDKYLDEATTFVDIGGWIGSTSLYASQLVKRAFVFEPDEVAYEELSANFKHNDGFPFQERTELIRAAIAPENGSIDLGFRTERGDSMSSVLLASKNQRASVKSINLHDFLLDKGIDQDKLFIKMDVEGFEYDILPALAYMIQTLPRASFLISLHPQFLLDKLLRETPSGKLQSSLIRKSFFDYHRQVLKAFKGYNCSFINGKPFNPRRELAKALLTGQFSRDVVFTKTP
jgi:FkbM family methyltransferase